MSVLGLLIAFVVGEPVAFADLCSLSAAPAIIWLDLFLKQILEFLH